MSRIKKIIARERNNCYNIRMTKEVGKDKFDMERKRYLKNVYMLESQIYTYQEIDKKYEKFLQKLKKEKRTIYLYETDEQNMKGRKQENYVMPAPEYKPSYLGERKNKHGHTESVFGFRGAFDMFRRLPKHWWDEELLALEKEEHDKYRRWHIIIIAAAVLTGILGSILLKNPLICVLMLLAGGGICYYIGDENRKEYLPGDPYYEKFMTFYEKKYKEDLLEKEAEVNPQIAHVEKEYQIILQPKMKEAKILLEKLYEKDVIPVQYRNFVAVTQFYDYSLAGRCGNMEDAVALYEKELKQERITTDLELSPFQMEKMSETMNVMMTTLKNSTQIVDRVAEQLYKIEENAALKGFVKQCDVKNDKIKKEFPSN